MSYKTSRQKMAALAMIGVVAAALVATVSFAPVSASAQERPSGEDASMHRFRTAGGAGIATDSSGDNFRSAIRAIWTYDNSTGERAMSRGMIVISVDDERVGYQFVPDTWQIDMAEDGLTFGASDKVEDSDGKVFDVSLNGYLGGSVGFVKRAGTTWSVDGEMTGEDAEYDLHYVMLAHPGMLIDE